MDIERMVVQAKEMIAFEENYKDATGFHHRAKQFLEEGQYSSVIFNVAAIALERYLIALCNLYGIYPANHSYALLMDDIEIAMDFPVELSKEIRAMELVFDICSLENKNYSEPDQYDSERILSVCSEIQELTNRRKSSLMVEGRG